MPCDSRAVANYFLELAEKHAGTSLSPMKLQKLVYYAHGWWLALTGEPLIDEQVMAWKFGPVIPSLYREFRSFGNAPIRDYAYSPARGGRVGPNRGRESEKILPTIHDCPEAADRVRRLLDRIWEVVYGDYTAIQLSNATHQPGTPWHEVYTQYQGDIPKHTNIPAELIKGHFRALARPKTPA